MLLLIKNELLFPLFIDLRYFFQFSLLSTCYFDKQQNNISNNTMFSFRIKNADESHMGLACEQP